MGITPHQYVLGKRIDMARELIEQGHLSLGQIAEFTGFSSQSTFTHTFTRLQGLSPSQYKKQVGKFTQKKTKPCSMHGFFVLFYL